MTRVPSRSRLFPGLLLAAGLVLSVGCTAMLMGGGQGGGAGGGAGGAAGEVDDGRLVERVMAALVAETAVEAGGIEVEASRQVVFLRGSVPTAAQRMRAAEVTAAVDGVAAVRNHLRVPTD